MKKISVFLILGALLLSCRKEEPETVVVRGDVPSWIDNEEEPVPIQFGTGLVISTKADQTVELDGQFRESSFRYGVTAIDDLGMPHVGVNGIAAKNKTTSVLEDGWEGQLKTVFVDGSGNEVSHYYPATSERGYTFYAYRTDNTNSGFNAITTSGANDYHINGIAMGPADVIWAKAAAPNGKGYNAKYIRSLMNASNYSFFYMSNTNAPRFSFEHLACRFIFEVKADDSYAELSMKDLVYITGIRLENTSTTASLDLMAGSLSSTLTDVGTVTVNRDEVTPYYPKNDDSVWGDPVFILPPSLGVYPTDWEGIKMVMTIHTPEDPAYEYSKILSLGGDIRGFQKGNSYKFVVSLKSYESIEISASVSAWSNGGSTDITIE